MIKLPANFTDPVFDQSIERGTVIKTLFHCKDGKTKPKFFILLNKDISQQTIVFVLTTSQLEFYNKNPHFNTEIIRIPSGTLTFFPKETIINCREVFRITRSKLKENFRNNVLEIEGKLPTDMLDNIDKIIEKSFFISLANKELILGNKC